MQFKIILGRNTNLMKTIDKALITIGMALVMIFGCAMDSESMVAPLAGVIAGCLLMVIGEIRCSCYRR